MTLRAEQIHLAESRESGYALPVVLLIIALGLLVFASNLTLLSGSKRNEQVQRVRSDRFYQAEAVLNKTAAWIRLNSRHFAQAFSRESFYTHFRKSEFGYGTNDSVLPVLSRIRLPGEGHSVVISNDTALVSGNFPSFTSFDGAEFSTMAEFSQIDFQEMLVRITLVDAVATNPSADFGPAPQPAPETDFSPIFRIDVMSGIETGIHLYGYFVGSREAPEEFGFFGRDFVNVGQDCDAYNAEEGSYTSALARAACPIRSAGPVCIRNHRKVFGSVATAGELTTAGACKGSICADLSCGETKPACQGASCDIPEFEPVPSWDELCSSSAQLGSLTIVGTQVLETSELNGERDCWPSVKINSGAKLVLTSTSRAYYFKQLELGSIEISPETADGVVTVYVEEIVGNVINGVSLVNGSARPSQLHLHYLGSNGVKLNGNADFQMFFYAPKAAVELLGNSDYFGGIAATSLILNGNARVHYDQSFSSSSSADLQFRFAQVSQYRR